MSEQPIAFQDADAYQGAVGDWSEVAGRVFLDWLAPPPALHWLDVGCGTGALTELLVRRCAPSALDAIDPSEPQLAYARTRPGLASATFHQADAMALPFADAQFGAAVMALVIFFVPEPALGVAEMVRVVRPGGLVCAYAWDFSVGGAPFEPVYAGMRAAGHTPSLPPNHQVAEAEPLSRLWTNAGLDDVKSRVIAIERVFDSFDHYWSVTTKTDRFRARFATMDPTERDAIRAEARARMTTDADGKVRFEAKANAIAGTKPA